MIGMFPIDRKCPWSFPAGHPIYILCFSINKRENVGFDPHNQCTNCDDLFITRGPRQKRGEMTTGRKKKTAYRGIRTTHLLLSGQSYYHYTR